MPGSPAQVRTGVVDPDPTVRDTRGASTIRAASRATKSNEAGRQASRPVLASSGSSVLPRNFMTPRLSQDAELLSSS